jgi:hypothetical protein
MNKSIAYHNQKTKDPQLGNLIVSRTETHQELLNAVTEDHGGKPSEVEEEPMPGTINEDGEDLLTTLGCPIGHPENVYDAVEVSLSKEFVFSEVLLKLNWRLR